MADVVRRVEYYYTEVPDRPGGGAQVLAALKAGGVNLMALNGFPMSRRRAQLSFVPSNVRAFIAAARKAGIKLTGPKTAFLIQGDDRAGAVAGIVSKLGKAGLNVVAMNAVAAGRRRYGAILWVKPRNVGKAAQILGAA
jgi:hypothetical protein